MEAIKAPRSLRPLAIGAGLAAALGAAPARADTASVEALVVRTRPNLPPYVDAQATYKVDRSASGKLTQPLLDTPKSVSVITEDLYDDLGATSFRDLMRTQPGVTLGTGEGGNAYGDRVFIRGFDARNDVYIDGVRDPGVGARELFDVDQVEILKGPSSAIGGRGTTGGAVSLVSKQPLMMPFGDFETTIGSDRTRRTTLDLNRPLTDHLQVRLNAMYTDAGVAGRRAVFNDRRGWAGAVAWKPVERLKLGFDYYHLSTNEMPDFGIPYDLAHNRPFDVDRKNFYGVAGRDFRTTFADIATARAEWSPSDALTLATLFRSGQTLNAYTASAPERPNPVADTVAANPKRRDAISDTWASQTSATLRFTTAGFTHVLVAGAEFSGETVTNRGRAFVECAALPCSGSGQSVVQSLLHPDPYRAYAAADLGVTSRTTAHVDSSAGYVLDTIKHGPFELSAGLRYDRYDLKLKQLTVATGALVRRENDVGFWNGQVALTWKPAANGSVYVAWATSSNPSGEQLDSTSLDYGGLDPRTAALEPERNHSWEVGSKWNVAGGHLALTAAAFRIDKTNARVALNANTVALAGHMRAQGIELGASGKITARWELFAGFTWLDAKILDTPTIAQIGARFPNVPEVSWSATSKYKLLDRVSVGATATYNGRRYGGTVAALSTSIPGYLRLDLFGTYQVTRKFSIDVNLLNATDKTYYDALYRSAAPFVYVAPGRALLVKADLHF